MTPRTAEHDQHPVTTTPDPAVSARLIAGMPRSGTTWLCHALNEHRDVAAFGELRFWGKNFIEPGEDGLYARDHRDRLIARLEQTPMRVTVGATGPGWMKRITLDDLPGLYRSAAGTLPEKATPAEVYRALGDAFVRAEGKSVAVEKTPHYLSYLDRVLGAMPGARVAVTLREPYSFALSYKHQGDRKPPERRAYFASRYHPIGAAWVWRASMRAARRAEREHPGSVLLVWPDRQDEEALLRDVCAHFGIDPAGFAAGVGRTNSSFSSADRPELAPEDVFWINRVAGREIRKAGFALRRTPWSPLRVLRSLIDVPFWMVRVRRQMSADAASPVAHLWKWIRS